MIRSSRCQAVHSDVALVWFVITDGNDSCTIILVFGIGLLVLTFEVKISKKI